MQKYKPVTTFLGISQHEQLLALANASRGHNQPEARQQSVSRLVRTAVMRLLQDLEEWQDAVTYNQHHPGTFLVRGRVVTATEVRESKFPQAFNEAV